jgi:hypothetical protein
VPSYLLKMHPKMSNDIKPPPPLILKPIAHITHVYPSGWLLYVCSSSSRVSSIAQLDEVRDMFTLESCCPTASIIHTQREREGLCYIDMGVGYTFGRHGPVDETLWEVKLCLLALCAYRFLLCVDDERAQVCHVTMRRRSPI